MSGVVYLIGAGPGDPGLLTVRGRELLETADVVVYDRLVHPSLLRHVRADAECVYVGKASAHHAMKQPDINALLVNRALKGLRVARLKGGDPFVFGRGGEEAEECRAAGIRFEIVPGVTSAISAPAYAGIPVTHRDMASSFVVVTGHERDDAGEAGSRVAGAAEGRRDWARLAHAADTLIFLMGVEALPEITSKLQANGRSAETPVALVQWGTWSRQRVVTGTLADIVEEVRRAGLTPPAVCVVGDVVRLRQAIRWFDDQDERPLFGKRVVVTRAREQASTLTDLLLARGADPIEFPAIRIQPLADQGTLERALADLSGYDWVVFTSVNSAPIVAQRLAASGRDARAFGSARVAAIGPATAESVRLALGVRADYVPAEAVGEAVIEGWPESDMNGRRVLIPRALEGRDLIPRRLSDMGAVVDVVPVYETVRDDSAAEPLRAQLLAREIDAVTFTSSSTVRNFVESLQMDGHNVSDLLDGVVVAAIGPVTAQTAQDLGLNVGMVADEHTIPGLVEALESHFHTARA